MKIGVGIRRTGTEGRFLMKGHENGPCIDESDTGDLATRSRAMQGMD